MRRSVTRPRGFAAIPQVARPSSMQASSTLASSVSRTTSNSFRRSLTASTIPVATSTPFALLHHQRRHCMNSPAEESFDEEFDEISAMVMDDEAAAEVDMTDSSSLGAGGATAEESGEGEGQVDEYVEGYQRPLSGSSREAVDECNRQVMDIIANQTVTMGAEEIIEALDGCRTNLDVRRVVDDHIAKHPLYHDPLNGHGFRVQIFGRLTIAATKGKAMEEWFDVLIHSRQMGYLLTRNFVANGLEIMRAWLNARFNLEGRNPQLASLATGRLRQLVDISLEDGVVLDTVLFCRLLNMLTLIVSSFDRQNRYRINWPASDIRRDGVVTDWVLGHERATDYDTVVTGTNAILDDILHLLAQTYNCRPSFSIMYRLMDYYFASDNVDGMIKCLKQCEELGIAVSDAQTAKMMQLATAFNVPETPELFMKYRVQLPQCRIQQPDVYRLLLFYCRSGGGHPCPHCGEPFNHRHVGINVYNRTESHRLDCKYLKLARRHKSEIEDVPELPQNRDWSEMAFGFLKFSEAKSITWGSNEWRAFLQCCMNGDQLKVREARKRILDSFSTLEWDDFLRLTVLRSLRYSGDAAEIKPMCESWMRDGSVPRWSPLALQEAMMGACHISDPIIRLETLQFGLDITLNEDFFVMPYTKRYIQANHPSKQKKGKKASSKPQRFAEVDSATVSPEERSVVEQILAVTPKNFTEYQLKDSSLDIVPGPHKKNIFKRRAPAGGVAGKGGNRRQRSK